MAILMNRSIRTVHRAEIPLPAETQHGDDVEGNPSLIRISDTSTQNIVGIRGKQEFLLVAHYLGLLMCFHGISIWSSLITDVATR